MQARTKGISCAAAAMFAVGSGVTASDALVDYPVLGGQAIRYGLAAVVLTLGVRATGQVLRRPTAVEWVQLFLLAAAGQALYNIAVIRAVGHAEPAAVAVLVGSVPIVLVLADAVGTRTRPRTTVVVGVALAVVGGALVQGGGRTSALGVAWSVVALLCEAAFTLLALRPLRRLGPSGVSTYTCWLAAGQLAVLAIVVDGADAVPVPTGSESLAIGYLALVLTAVAFVLWYTAVERLGPATAGLFAGLVPLAATVTGLIAGITTVTVPVVCGAMLVSFGIALGLARPGLAGPGLTGPGSAGPERARAAGTGPTARNAAIKTYTTRTFWASSPLRPGATSNSTR